MDCIVVEPSSPRALRERVYRLRHRIYVREMQLPVAAGGEHGDMLCDEFDDFSHSLLLTVRGEDIGTLRLTPKTGGKLELEAQSEEWAATIAGERLPAAQVVEWNRFMVVRHARGGIAAPALFYHAFLLCRARGYRYMLGAGKLGSLTKNYMKYSARILDAAESSYVLHGHDFGRYVLLLADVGLKGSPRNAWRRAKYEFLYRLLLTSVGSFNALFRRGAGYAVAER